MNNLTVWATKHTLSITLCEYLEYNKNPIRAAISSIKSSTLVLQPAVAELLMESPLDHMDNHSKVNM